MKQSGFITLPLATWGALAVGVIIIGLGAGVRIQTDRLHNEQAAHAATQAQFDAFKAEVERQGKEAQAKVEAEKARQKQVTQERSASYEKRLAAINTAYRRLRDQHAGPGGGAMPAVPATARSADDAARDQQLRDVLQYADQQTGQLIELQEWIREQGRVGQ